MSIAHEVNILVLNKKRQEELTEPLCPTPDVSSPSCPSSYVKLMIFG